MIVCHRHRFIFVHLHKTAGTSVSQALLPHLSKRDVVIGVPKHGSTLPQGLDDSLQLLSKHSTAQHISEAVGEETWNSYFKFTFVRHPFDRLVSLYEFFNRVRRNNTIRPGILNRIFSMARTHHPMNDPNKPPWTWKGMQALLTTTDFSGFIRSEHLANAQGARSQAQSLTDSSGKLMVDFVGKVENISADWQTICDELGIQQTLSHANSSERQFENILRYWNKDNVRFASEKYREDFELFGYSPVDIL